MSRIDAEVYSQLREEFSWMTDDEYDEFAFCLLAPYDEFLEKTLFNVAAERVANVPLNVFAQEGEFDRALELEYMS